MIVPVPLPDTTDPVAGPHWDAARSGRLAMQQCFSCGYIRWPVAVSCPECLAEGGEWVTLSGRAVIWSYAVYERPLHPAFERDCPYAVGLIHLEEGPMMYGRVEIPADGLACGMSVEAFFAELAADVCVARFRRRPGQ